MNTKPIHDNVVILQNDNESQTKTGLFMPDMAKGHKNNGKVMAVGPGVLLQDGTRAPMQVAVGDDVWFNSAAGFPITEEGIEYFVVGEEQIFAVA